MMKLEAKFFVTLFGGMMAVCLALVIALSVITFGGSLEVDSTAFTLMLMALIAVGTVFSLCPLWISRASKNLSIN